MEVAKLFASVGFRVDTKNLDTFDSRLANTQVKFVQFANSIDNLGKQATQATATDIGRTTARPRTSLCQTTGRL